MRGEGSLGGGSYKIDQSDNLSRFFLFYFLFLLLSVWGPYGQGVSNTLGREFFLEFFFRWGVAMAMGMGNWE